MTGVESLRFWIVDTTMAQYCVLICRISQVIRMVDHNNYIMSCFKAHVPMIVRTYQKGQHLPGLLFICVCIIMYVRFLVVFETMFNILNYCNVFLVTKLDNLVKFEKNRYHLLYGISLVTLNKPFGWSIFCEESKILNEIQILSLIKSFWLNAQLNHCRYGKH